MEKTQVNSAILNAIAEVTESSTENKTLMVNAFKNSMSHMDCGHEFCESVGHILAQYIEEEDWNGLGNFLDYGE